MYILYIICSNVIKAINITAAEKGFLQRLDPGDTKILTIVKM